MMRIRLASWHPQAQEPAQSPIPKTSHQHKYLNLQGEKTALATIAHFKFCMRTRRHAGDWDPLAETLQSCGVLERDFAMCQRPRGIPRKPTTEAHGLAGAQDGLRTPRSSSCLLF